MTKSMNAAFATALISASVLGASTAFAGGDGEYYEGASPQRVEQMQIDNYSTQSINKSYDGPSTPESITGDGEYYEGAAPEDSSRM